MNTVPHRLYNYISPDNLSGCLRLTAPKACQPKRMSRCKVSKPKKMSRPTKQTRHFLGFIYFTSGHSLGLGSFLCCQSQTTREIVRPNIFIKGTRDGDMAPKWLQSDAKSSFSNIIHIIYFWKAQLEGYYTLYLDCT